MTGVNRALANLRIKISTKGYGKKDDRVKIIRNDVLNDNKKRVSDHVNGGKEKRQRMDYRSITQERGWDREKKRKIHESGEQPNQWESDSQGMNKSCQKKTPLHKEKESPSSDHSSCATTVEGCTTSLTPTKALRAAQLKKRFADLIFKANHQSVMPQGDKPDPLKLQQERERLQKEQIAEQARIEEQIKVAEAVLRIRAEAELKMQRQREREAARIALDKMEKTVEFNDALQIMRDFESLLNSVC